MEPSPRLARREGRAGALEVVVPVLSHAESPTHLLTRHLPVQGASLTSAVSRLGALRPTLWYVALALLCLSDILVRIDFHAIAGFNDGMFIALFHVASAAIFCACWLLQPARGVPDALLTACLLVLALVCGRSAGQLTPLWVTVTLVSCQGVSVRRACAVFFCCYAGGLVLAPTLSLLGVLPLYQANNMGIPVLSLGFVHKNAVALFLAVCACSFCVWQAERRPFVAAALALACALACNAIGSRTAFALVLALALSVVILSMRSGLPGRIWAAVLALSAMAGIALIVFSTLSFSYGNKVQWLFDKVLSTRLYESNSFFREYGLTPLGNGFEVTESHPLDSSYAFMMLKYGVIPFLVVMLASVLAVLADVHGLFAMRRRASMLLVCFLVFLLYGVTENVFYNVPNIFLVFIPYWFYTYRNIGRHD